MTNNVLMVQKQIKAFNKALSRADKASVISNSFYEAITDLIEYDRMTKSGYGKAGTKYLEKMSPEELMSYSADIQQANNLVKLAYVQQQLLIGDVKDKKSLLWSIYDKLSESSPYLFDSDDVKAVADEDVKIDYVKFILEMNKYFKNGEKYGGLSEFKAWFAEQTSLQE